MKQKQPYCILHLPSSVSLFFFLTLISFQMLNSSSSAAAQHILIKILFFSSRLTPLQSIKRVLDTLIFHVTEVVFNFPHTVYAVSLQALDRQLICAQVFNGYVDNWMSRETWGHRDEFKTKTKTHFLQYQCLKFSVPQIKFYPAIKSNWISYFTQKFTLWNQIWLQTFCQNTVIYFVQLNDIIMMSIIIIIGSKTGCKQLVKLR